VVGVAFVLATYAWSLPLKVTGGGLQLLGIMLAGLGVNVVRSWLTQLPETAKQLTEAAKDKFAELLDGIAELWTVASTTFGGPVIITRGETEGDEAEGDEEISDHDLLVALTQEVNRVRHNVESVRHDVENLSDRLKAERILWEHELLTQREQLQATMTAATRQGWQLILAGLAFSAVGTFVGMFG
jgi:hypothetical protein